MSDCVSSVYLEVDEFSPCVLWSLMIGLMVVLLTIFRMVNMVLVLRGNCPILGNGCGI